MASRDVLERPAAGPDLVLRYDGHPDAVIDVFLPPETTHGRAAAPRPAPLAVFLHGGFWRAEWDRTHARPLAWGLVAAGFVVATPEYRRGPRSWPAMSADVEAALVAVRGLVDSAAPHHIEATAPYVLAGHSAGGHLALWAGLRAGPAAVSRIVALAPVSDVRYAARTGMGDRAAQDLLGGEPDEVPDAYADADVLALLPGHVAITLIQGDADKQVTVDMNRHLASSTGFVGETAGGHRAPTADQSAGATRRLRYVELPGVDHFALIDPESDAWPVVRAALVG